MNRPFDRLRDLRNLYVASFPLFSYKNRPFDRLRDLISLFIHKEHRNLADATGTDDQGLLDVGGAARPCDDGHLRGLVFGVFPFHGLESSTHPGHDLLRGAIYQQDVGQGVGLTCLRQGIGKDDAARLGHQAFATRQADQFLLRLTFLAFGKRNAIFGQKALHPWTGAPQGLPSVFGD